jgi:phosphatidylinositol-3-phosphatase
LAAALAAIGVVSAGVIGGGGGSSSARPSSGPAGAGGPASTASPVANSRSRVTTACGGTPRHVAVIVMENKEYGEVIGSAAAPFINGLARRYALARGMLAATHPPLPTYLALTGGSTFGITSDSTACSVAATSIVDQLESAHVSWKAYMEDLPHPCFTGASAGELRGTPHAGRTRSFSLRTAHGARSHRRVRLEGSRGRHSLRRRREARRIWPNRSL